MATTHGDAAQSVELQPLIADPDFTLYVGDTREVLRALPAESVDCCVTSPPYWGLRNYGTDGQIGLELTPDDYVAEIVTVFGEVRRLLRPNGTLWLNLGDSYAAGGNGARDPERWPKQSRNADGFRSIHAKKGHGVKPKDLIGIPWRVAFALQADGWWLRSDIIWSKPNPMPESVTDRPTKSHEYLFLLSKSPRYFYDADAIREPAEWSRWGDQTIKKPQPGKGSWLQPKTKAELDAVARPRHRKTPLVPEQTKQGVGRQGRDSQTFGEYADQRGRNRRSVWEVATESYPEAHFATFPQALVEPCIKAGCRAAGVVLDPFMGSGTTALVARRLGRRAVGVELNQEYAALAAKRLSQLSLLAEEVA